MTPTSAPAPAERRVVVIDHGIGNITSVMNALSAVAAAPHRARDPRALVGATHVVLPGVGAFRDGMASLHEGGWIGPLEAVVREQEARFLGICLGMQLMAAYGEENGRHPGLGWLESNAVRLPTGVRVPHVGWNDVAPVNRPSLLGDKAHSFYFVHSYAIPADEPAAVGLTTHGRPFAAAVQRGNLHGVQFHPEKSHRAGLALLRAFVDADSAC